MKNLIIAITLLFVSLPATAIEVDVSIDYLRKLSLEDKERALIISRDLLAAAKDKLIESQQSSTSETVLISIATVGLILQAVGIVVELRAGKTATEALSTVFWFQNPQKVINMFRSSESVAEIVIGGGLTTVLNIHTVSLLTSLGLKGLRYEEIDQLLVEIDELENFIHNELELNRI